MLRTAEMVKLYCIFHRGYLEEVLHKLQNLDAVQFFNVREKFKFLSAPEQAKWGIKELEKVEHLIAEIKPRADATLLEKIFGPRKVFIALARGATEEILRKTREELHSFEEKYLGMRSKREELLRAREKIEEEISKEKITLLRQALKMKVEESELERVRALRRDEEKISPQLLELNSEIERLERDSYLELLSIREKLQNIVQRAHALKNFGAMQHSFFFGCWVPRKKLHRVIRALERATNGYGVITVEEVELGEEAPTLLENPWFVKPYEILTESYGVPKYGEADSTPILAITFTAFFGIMFADIGYGIVLSFLSLIVFIKTTKKDVFQKNLNLILLYAGTASFVFGLLFGEFFGGLVHIAPLWREPIKNVELLLLLSISVGICHISISILSRSVSDFLGGKLIWYPLSLLVILWSSIFLVAFSSYYAWYTLVLGIVLLVASKRIEAFEELLALCANIISYVRIAVLCVLHVMIARLLVSALLFLPAGILGIITGAALFLFGVVLILASGVFLVFIHSLRLHWLEFFKRFYSGVGERFKPFAAHREYTYVMG